MKNKHIISKKLCKHILLIAYCSIAPDFLNAQCNEALWKYCDITPCFESKVSITNAGYWKVITSNGIPNHKIGIFPLLSPECGRPTALSEQSYTFVIPAYSVHGIRMPGTVFNIPKPPVNDLPQTTFGVAVNGVPFDPVAAEWYDTTKNSIVSEPGNPVWNLNTLRNDSMATDLDCNNAHLQPNGAYHYHGYPYGLYNKIYEEQRNSLNKLTRDRDTIVLLGWAFDGNPIYGEQCGKDKNNLVIAKSSYKLRTDATARNDIQRPKTSVFSMGEFSEDYWYDLSLFTENPDVYLDECNGHTGFTPEFVHGVYHYHILEKTEHSSDIGFPYIGRCYRLFTYGEGPNIFPKPPK